MNCVGKTYECTGCAYSLKTNTVYYCGPHGSGWDLLRIAEPREPEYQSEGLGDF